MHWNHRKNTGEMDLPSDDDLAASGHNLLKPVFGLGFHKLEFSQISQSCLSLSVTHSVKGSGDYPPPALPFSLMITHLLFYHETLRNRWSMFIETSVNPKAVILGLSNIDTPESWPILGK